MSRRFGVVRAESAARTVTAVYALATVAAFFLRLGVRHAAARPSAVELLFGLLNIPVAHTLVSFVLLGLITWALLTRKRIGWVAAVVCQLVGIGLGMLALVTLFVGPNGWPARRVFSHSLDVASIVVGAAALVILWQIRAVFRGSVRRGSWLRLTLALVIGTAATVTAVWLVLSLLNVSSGVSRLRQLVVVVALGLGDVDASRRLVWTIPEWVSDMVEVLAAATMIIALVLFLRSAKDPGAWSGSAELRLRRLLAEHGEEDSLGYFATRRDKSTVFGSHGRAAVTFRVLNGVALASGDPVGDQAMWPDAIAAWLGQVRHYGWQPAVLAASETGARAYAAAGFNVLMLGDEAILDADRFSLSSTTMTPVRHAVQRLSTAGLRVEIHRQQDLPTPEVEALAQLADQWRHGGTERGFSMALGRCGDPSDARNLWVLARDANGEPVGLLSFVPWGRHGVSLDLMRRSPTAPNGVTQLMVSQLLAAAQEHTIRRVSLNFCTLRGVYAAGDRFGANTLTRLNTSLLSLFDRFWQLERLYRATQRYQPDWSPRFLCYDDRVALPLVLWAAASAEGFLPRWPSRSTGQQRQLTDDERATALDLEAVEPDWTMVGPRRSDQTAVRIGRLDDLRRAGRAPYPVGLARPGLTVAEITDAVWLEAAPVRVSGRVRSVRDHGSVVFLTLEDTGRLVQALLESPDRHHTAALSRLVDVGDLIVIDAVPGTSRNGTPSLLITDWQMAAKSLHPVPFTALTDAEYRQRHRSTDLLVHPVQASRLRDRSKLVHALRTTLAADGYLEVETPMLNTVHGGATARPFRTFINAYGEDLTLRIAPELHLKRLLVGGLGPLFEIGRNFRNEGADASHNPEFTSLEAYLPWGDYHAMRLLTERLVVAGARAVHGRPIVPATALRPDEWIDVDHPWPVVPVLEAVSCAVGATVDLSTDMDELMRHAARHGVALRGRMGPGAIIEQLYGELVEPRTQLPTFYIDFPVETSPLTAPHRSRPGLAERWDLVINGMEIATAYSELTDPIEQRRRLTEQSLKAAAGDLEAMKVDEEFLFALETGMPPAGGLGIGVDRLAMIVTGASMRDVLSFPFVRPDRGH